MSKNTFEESRPTNPPDNRDDDEHAQLLEFFESLEPRTEHVRRLKELRVAALRAGQPLLDDDGIRRAVGRRGDEPADDRSGSHLHTQK